MAANQEIQIREGTVKLSEGVANFHSSGIAVLIKWVISARRKYSATQHGRQGGERNSDRSGNKSRLRISAAKINFQAMRLSIILQSNGHGIPVSSVLLFAAAVSAFAQPTAGELLEQKPPNVFAS